MDTKVELYVLTYLNNNSEHYIVTLPSIQKKKSAIRNKYSTMIKQEIKEKNLSGWIKRTYNKLDQISLWLN